jgi:hypothetical protein
MKNFLLFCCLFVNVIAVKSQLSEQSKVYLLTCEVGDEIYEQFGHSAIRIEDPINDIDQCYNWGMFEFGEDEFEFNMKFAKGSLDYFMAVEPLEYFLYPYQITKREVIQQELNLTLELRNKLWNLLLENAKPENKFYRYDFFFDNCATRIDGFLQLLLGDKLLLAEIPEITNQTYRAEVDRCFSNYPWTGFGVDLVLGYKIDVKMGNEGVMFSPIFMSQVYEESQIITPTGTQNLVLSRDVIVQGVKRDESHDVVFTPLVVTIIILVITILLSFFKLNVVFKIWSSFLFVLLGILGCLLLFMWFGTEHLGTKGNLNVIWANPLLIILAFVIWIKKLNMKIGKAYLVIAFIMFGLILFFMMLPQEFPAPARVLIINLSLQFYILHKMNIKQVKKTDVITS